MIVQKNTLKIHRECSSEEKIRVVLAGLRDKDSIAELCRSEGISPYLSTRARNLTRQASGAQKCKLRVEEVAII